jgi:23S rRNA pseudouridine2604 synthase
MTEPVRLSKRVSALAGCSRSQAEMYIEGGWVTVDDVVVREPQFRVTDQQVRVAADAGDVSLAPVTLLLNQAADGAVLAPTPENRAAGDASGIQPLRRHFSRLQPALPLPVGASGLVVLTQDARIARRLREDAALIEQECVVDVSGDIAPDGLARLGRGLVIDHLPLPPVKVSWQSERRLRFALKGVAPDQIAALCAAVGLRAEAVRRLRIGRVALAGLPPGQWRYLRPHERF